MKALLNVAFILSCFTVCIAQQEPETDMYWNRMVHYNPASIGINETTAVNLHGRNQWNGTNGAPKTIAFNAAQQFSFLHGAVGLSYEYDEIGNSNMHTALLNYAFHIPINQCVLSIGASAGIARYQVKSFWTTPQTTTDPNIPQTFSDVNFQADAGIVFNHPNFNAGISVTQLNQPKYGRNGNVYFRASDHYYIFGDYTFKLSKAFSLKPQVMLSTDVVFWDINATLLATVKEKFWFGVNYSRENSFGGCVGYDFFNKFRLGYSYSYSKRISFIGHTHEAVLSFLIKK